MIPYSINRVMLNVRLLNIYIYVFLFSIPLLVIGQHDSSKINDRKERRNALFAKKIGNYYFEQSKFLVSRNYYYQAVDVLKDDPDLLYNLAVSLLGSYPQASSLTYFKRAYALKSDLPFSFNYYYAKALHLNMEFSDALIHYLLFLNDPEIQNNELLKKQVLLFIQQCNSGMNIMSKPLMITLNNAGEKINTEYNEYRPFVLADGKTMLFTSLKNELKKAKKFIYVELVNEEVYNSSYQNGQWNLASQYAKSLNSTGYKAIVGSAPGDSLFIFFDGKKNNGDLFTRTFNGNKWSIPQYLEEQINDAYTQSSASFNATLDTIYFVSDNPVNSVGAKDIYLSYKSKEGIWSTPINLGASINSSVNEEGVFFDYRTRDLYFSSQGPTSMGGYDIFHSNWNSKTQQWMTPENMGYPYNTPADDYFYLLSADHKTAYFSSTREASIGQSDIFIVHIAESLDDMPKISSDILFNDSLLPFFDTLNAEKNIVKPIIRDTIRKVSPTKTNYLVRIRMSDDSDNTKIKTSLDNSNGDIVAVNFSSYGKPGVKVAVSEKTQIMSREAYTKVDKKKKDTIVPQIEPFQSYPNNDTQATSVLIQDDKRASSKKNKATKNQVMNDSSSIYYTIQLRIMNYAVDKRQFFPNLIGVQEYYCNDSNYRYAIGSFKGWSNVLNQSKHIKELGYREAYAINLENYRQHRMVKTSTIEYDTAFAIILFESEKKVVAPVISGFRVRECYTSKGNYVYVAGSYVAKKQANKDVELCKQAGYREARIEDLEQFISR